MQNIKGIIIYVYIFAPSTSKHSYSWSKLYFHFLSVLSILMKCIIDLYLLYYIYTWYLVTKISDEGTSRSRQQVPLTTVCHSTQCQSQPVNVAGHEASVLYFGVVRIKLKLTSLYFTVLLSHIQKIIDLFLFHDQWARVFSLSKIHDHTQTRHTWQTTVDE